MLSSLGQLSELEIENLRTALAASRGGSHVVVRGPGASEAPAGFVEANLRYLDLSVLLDVWHEWGLDSLLEQLSAASKTEVALPDMVASLVLHRVVDPGSRLHAQRWFPTTALPEMTGVRCAQFNNSRIHRVLSELEHMDEPLQERLAAGGHGCQAFTALILYVSDVWFVGQGPDLAQKGKTKEGMIRRRIGIVLLVNELGYPLRWAVVPGNSHDAHGMQQMIDGVAECGWGRNVPLSCDRITGRRSSLSRLAGSGLHFVTAVPSVEFEPYTSQVPRGSSICLEPAGVESAPSESSVSTDRPARSQPRQGDTQRHGSVDCIHSLGRVDEGRRLDAR